MSSTKPIEKSPILDYSTHENNNNNVNHNADDNEDDDDDLPDVRFQESILSTPTVLINNNNNNNNKSSNLKLNKNTLLTSKTQTITGNYETVLNFKEKFAKYNEYVKIKEVTDEAIKRGGFQFDKYTQLIARDEDDENVQLDEEQLELLKRWNSNVDSLIPLKPDFDKLFNLSIINCLYKYPNDFKINSFNYNSQLLNNNENILVKILNGNIHQICEKNLFFKFYSEVATNDKERVSLLSHLFYYSTCMIDDYKVLVAFETLSSIFIENKFLNTNWKISGSMLLQVYKNLGLDLSEFKNKFSKLVEIIEESAEGCINKNINDKNQILNVDYQIYTIFDLIINKFLDILLLSIKKRSNFYSEFELDFLFLMIIYTSLDENYEKLNVRLQSKLILNEIIDTYSENIWPLKKFELCEKILLIASKHCHRIIYLNSYFELTSSKRVRELSYQIAYNSALKILFNDQIEINNERGTLSINELNFFLKSLNENSVEIFTNSSYKMYILIKCVDSILVEIMNQLEREQINIFVSELKIILTTIRRTVKDRFEYQGRHQVKVILTNLISKCEYYLNEYNRKKLTLSNIIFNDNTENIINDNDDQDNEEPMNIEKNLNNNLDTTVNNLSFLPSID